MTIDDDVYLGVVPIESETNAGQIKVLIKEARRRQRLRYLAAAVALVATGVGLGKVIDQASNSTPARTGQATSVANFINSMKQANGTRFVATYRLNDYLFFQNGTIVIAQIPSPSGTKETTNVDGYSGTGRDAYLYHGPGGRIAQWIKNGTNVSACAKLAGSGTFGKLQCSRPSPYIPSNGFIEEDAGFVPTYVLQSITELFGARSLKKAAVTTRVSQEFGSLRCLTQMSGPTTQTTCINQAGFVVSWLLQNGSGSSSRSTLTSLNHHPTADDFKTLIRPTKSLILPSV
ncbi:MAG: hypothetical protein ACYC19_08425 [Acidimicrobiales bacterium]